MTQEQGQGSAAGVWRWKGRRMLALGSAVLLSAGVAGVVAWRGVAPAAAQQAEKPASRDVVARGRIEPAGRVIVINAPADSTVTVIRKLMVDQGSEVKAGQVLAILDGYNLYEADLKVQEGNLALAQRQLAQVRAGAKAAEIAAQNDAVAARRTLFQQAQSQLTRQVDLHKGGFVSKQALDDTQAAHDRARNELAQAENVLRSLSQVRKADEDVAAAQVAVAQAAVVRSRAALERLVVRAPSAGTVLAVNARAGDAIGMDGILRMADLTKLIVVAEVDESQVGRITEGMTGRIQGNPMSAPVNASVTRVAHEVYRQKRPTSDILVGRDAKVVEIELTPAGPLPRVVGSEVMVQLTPTGKR